MNLIDFILDRLWLLILFILSIVQTNRYLKQEVPFKSLFFYPTIMIACIIIRLIAAIITS